MIAGPWSPDPTAEEESQLSKVLLWPPTCAPWHKCAYNLLPPHIHNDNNNNKKITIIKKLPTRKGRDLVLFPYLEANAWHMSNTQDYSRRNEFCPWGIHNVGDKNQGCQVLWKKQLWTQGLSCADWERRSRKVRECHRHLMGKIYLGI